jgi:hypothetical protein
MLMIKAKEAKKLVKDYNDNRIVDLENKRPVTLDAIFAKIVEQANLGYSELRVPNMSELEVQLLMPILGENGFTVKWLNMNTMLVTW